MDSFNGYIEISELNKVSPLLSSWFNGSFMHGKIPQSNELVEAFRLFAKVFGKPTSPMTLFRIEQQDRGINDLIEIGLQPISSWCKSDTHARMFYHQVPMDKNSPVRLKPHAIVKSTFQPQELLISVEEVLPKINELLEKMEKEFPYRLANVYHNMEWHKDQKEVVVNAPGKRTVKVVQWL